MAYDTNKHHLPAKCYHSDLINTMVLNVIDNIQGYIGAGFTRIQALNRVKQESCAGSKVWKIVIEKIDAYCPKCGTAAEYNKETDTCCCPFCNWKEEAGIN